jgi:hypothetical protein
LAKFRLFQQYLSTAAGAFEAASVRYRRTADPPRITASSTAVRRKQPSAAQQLSSARAFAK